MNGWIYGANNPLTYSDPSGKCYGILSWERGVQGLSTLCTYMDEAYAISGCSNATSEEKLLANSYITGMIFSQAAFVFGGGYLAGEATLGAFSIGSAVSAEATDCMVNNQCPAEQATDNIVTVIGRYPANKILANSIGANWLNDPMTIWNQMSKTEQLERNMQWLQEAIIRGDVFRLASPISAAAPDTLFFKELDYLINTIGYHVTLNGSYLVK